MDQKEIEKGQKRQSSLYILGRVFFFAVLIPYYILTKYFESLNKPLLLALVVIIAYGGSMFLRMKALRAARPFPQKNAEEGYAENARQQNVEALLHTSYVLFPFAVLFLYLSLMETYKVLDEPPFLIALFIIIICAKVVLRRIVFKKT